MAESGNLNILIETGTDFVLPFTIYDNNGDPLDLTGATVESQLREYAEAYDFFEFACMHNGSGGRITVTMPHETTAQIPFTHGVYDVKVTMADGTISHPLSGEAYIKEGVTKSSDGSILFMLGINSFENLPEVGNVDRLYFVYGDRRIYRWNGSNYIGTAIGNGIRKIEFVQHVDDFTDKYTLTYDDLTTWDFYVTSKGIDHIEKVGSTGTVRTGIIDQYRIHFNNNDTHDYYVTNGRAFDVKTSYDATQAYEYLDMVKVDGATYVAVQDVPENTEITNTSYWLKIIAPLTMGTVTTVGAQDLADASIGGTADAPVLNLTIPRGVPGNESIDDTAGVGDTDKVWSADKSYIEKTALKNSIDAHSDIISTNLMGIDVQQNLYPGAADWSGEWTASDAVNIINSTALFNGYPAMRSKVSWNRYFRLIPITAGKNYTFEAWIKCDVAGSIFAYATWPNHVENVATISANSKQVNNIPANTWTKITFTFSCTASGNVGPFVLCSSGAFDFAHYVLVEGTSVFSLSDALNSKTPLSDFNAVKDKTDIIVSNVNALENLTVTENKVYERNTANVVDNNYANIYPVVRIESGKTYYYRNLYAYFCLVKYDGGTNTPFSNDQSVVVNGSFTASGDGNVYISVRRGQNGFVFTDSKALYDSRLTASFDTIDVQNIPKTYHVEKDGSGDFDSLVDAIEEATKYMDSVVYVGAGTWDLIDELGTEYVESVSISKRGVYLKNRIHLIFDPKAIVLCVYTGTRSDTIAWLSAFNAGGYGFTLENANIITGNIRYCVHDERDQDPDFYTNRYINCNMYHDSSYTQGGQNQCIGGGLGLNGHIVIDGCVFENPQKENAAIVSYHNSAGANAKSFIDVHGCYVKGTNTMRFRYYGATPDTQKTTILCHDNSVGHEIAFGPETEGSTNVNMELLAWNNTVRT